MTITIENKKFKKQTSIVSNVSHFKIERYGNQSWLIIYPSKEEPAYEYDTYRKTTNIFTEQMSIDLGGSEINVCK